MSSSCNQFRPNFWRPTICSYCCRPKGKHNNSYFKGYVPSSNAGWIQPDNNSEYFFIPPRAHTISTASPSFIKGRRQNSEPPKDSIIDERHHHSCGDFISTHTAATHQRVGVVKPYAVVDLNDTWAAQAAIIEANRVSQLKWMSQQDGEMPAFPRQRSGSCNALMFHRVSSSSNQHSPHHNRPSTLPSHSTTKRSIIPKRKAPPPPAAITPSLTPRSSYGIIPQPRLLRQGNRASSVPSLLITDEMIEDIPTPLSFTNTRAKRESPPNKPPRTQSTFVIQDEEETNTHIIQQASDYEPLRRPGQLSHISTGVEVSLLQQLQDMFTYALTDISVKYFNELTSTDNIKSIDWSDITVCVDLSNQHQLYYHMEPITLEPLDSDKHTTELEMVKSLDPHINLELIQGTLKQAPIDYADFLPDANHFVVRDSSPNKVRLDKILSQWHKTQSEEEYCHSILLVLVQVLQGLKYLFNNGIVHRDIGLESLIAWTHDIGCIIKLHNFSYALYRPGPISVTTFVFGYHELSWLGGVESHLPPEIIDTPSNANTLDYAHTDSFAVGCLIYELVTGLSPFDKDPQLVYSDYTSQDIPSFIPSNNNSSSNISSGSNGLRVLQYLQQLAHLLLTRDPLKRLGLNDALLLIQSMLWLPHSWLEHSISKESIEDHLTYLKATLITELAQVTKPSCIKLENLLKANFLATSNSADLIRALSVMNQPNVYGICSNNKQ